MIIKKEISETIPAVPAIPEQTVTKTTYSCAVCSADFGSSAKEANLHYGRAHAVKKTAQLYANDVAFWFDSASSLEAWLIANKSERHRIPEWRGVGWYVSYTYFINEYDDYAHYISAKFLADYETELRDELHDKAKQLTSIRNILNTDALREVPVSMVSADNTVELPDFVLNDFRPGQYVYFVKQKDGLRLMTQAAMDDYMGGK